MMIMGHRGAAALEPENTLRSISRALEIGVDAVEIDVHLTRDHELVVIHDETVDRTTNGKGAVSMYDLSVLRALDAGKGEKVPTLQEVIDMVRGKVMLVIELKAPDTYGPVVDAITKNDFFKESCVISFWHDMVRDAKELDQRVQTGVLFVGCPVDTAVALHAGADAVVMRYSFVHKKFVEKAHRDGLKVLIWNIDDPERLPPYVAMGVDGIASNDPRVLVDYFR
jgi:glycerophosphoryl diester phosphodiesterase